MGQVADHNANPQQLTNIKRDLVAARIHVQKVKAKARTGDDNDLAGRLHDIAERTANELDYAEMLSSRVP